MEHCKKLVLVPHESIAKLHERPAGRTSEDVMNDLDKEMHKILKQKADDSEKWKLYDQALQKYLYFVNEQKKPALLFAPEINESKNVEASRANEPHFKDKLLALIPDKFKKSASFLFDHLSTQGARKFIRWDSNGKTLVGDETLPSIIDLISDAVRTRKTSQLGAKEKDIFLGVLKSLDTPLQVIGNEQYISVLKGQTGSGVYLVNHDKQKETARKTTHRKKRPAKNKNRKENKTKKPKISKKCHFGKTKWRKWH